MNNKNVIANISGGLGNQMFMYATARALALRNGAELILEYDDTGRRDGYDRIYELQAYNIQGCKSSFLSYKTLLGRLLRKIYNRTGIKIPYIPTTTFNEKEGFIYDPTLLTSNKRNIYLKGYWQSEKYFKDFEKEIRNDFEYKIHFSSEIQDELAMIQSYGERAVALCVRRYQEVKKFIHLKRAEKEYYLKAIEEIKKNIKDPVFFCFSQTPEWVKKEFSDCGIEVIYIKPKLGANASHEDMYLLRTFKNYIISNSSYYWWGAWLSKQSDKLIVSPNNWCCDESNCESWVVID